MTRGGPARVKRAAGVETASILPGHSSITALAPYISRVTADVYGTHTHAYLREQHMAALEGPEWSVPGRAQAS